MRARAVIFDLFGTLVDDSPPSAQAAMLQETARLLGADPDRFRAIWRERDVARYTEPIETWFESACDELGLADRAGLDGALVHRRRILCSLLVPRPDAVETLRTLRERGFRLGMISNASSEVSGLWAESAFATLFDATLFSADEQMMKPDRRIYERMAELLGVAVEDAVFVGDGAYRELQGAAEAGMTPILIRVPHDEWEHEGTIGWGGPRVSALRDVLELLTLL